MSVYIKGMKIPTSCLKCSFNDEYGDCVFRDNEPYACDYSMKSRPEWCPLVELPAQHGRLIDADKLTLTEIDIALCEDYKSLLSLYINKVENASTIIEAEGAETDG